MSDLVMEAFGLRRQAFSLDIDVEGFYPSQSFQQGLLRLEQIARTRGSALVVGESGVGKTALFRALMRRLMPSAHQILEQLVQASGPQPFRAVVEGLLSQLGEPLPFNNSARALARLKRAFQEVAEKQRTPVVLLDDVQHFSNGCWLSLKSLLNYEMDSKLLLLLVCLGSPRTLRLLGMSPLEEIRDRFSFCYYLKGLQEKEVGPYLEHRLKWAGATRPLFPEEIVNEIARQSQGTPRRVNRLAQACLLAAASQNKQLVDRPCLEAALSELQFQPPREED